MSVVTAVVEVNDRTRTIRPLSQLVVLEPTSNDRVTEYAKRVVVSDLCEWSSQLFAPDFSLDCLNIYIVDFLIPELIQVFVSSPLGIFHSLWRGIFPHLRYLETIIPP